MNKAQLLLLLGVLSTLSIARAEIPQPLVDVQWLAENHASVVVLDARKETGTFVDGHISGATLVDVTTIRVEQALADDTITPVDTRDFRYHVGLEKKDYVFAYGHIPGSRSLPYKFLNPAKGSTRYLDHETYVKLLDSLRIDMDDSLILYCNSAYECSSDWFVLHEILGKQDVRVYDGSLHQWTQYESNPLTTRLSD